MIIDGNKLFNLTDDDGQDEATRGSLLVAKPQLDDAYFERSVVLLTGVDNAGAMGLIVNHLTGFMLGDVLTGWGDQASGIPLYIGGPVGLNSYSTSTRCPPMWSPARSTLAPACALAATSMR